MGEGAAGGGATALAVAVVTLFPGLVEAFAGHGVTGRAVERGVLRLECVNPRSFARDRHRTVDDRPYGGGPGMVMRFEPLHAATRAARERLGGARVVYLSPQGARLDQETVRRLAGQRRLVLVCGRYEGVDERFVEADVDEEISIGDYVLAGGELAALVLVEAMSRLVPGVLGHRDSASEDSFAERLLDWPHYTRPERVAGRAVPAVLLGGDHGAVRRWRRKQALGRTLLRRPDLLRGYRLEAEDARLLDEFCAEHGLAREDEDQSDEQHHS